MGTDNLCVVLRTDQLIENHAKLQLDKVAVRFQHESLTYAQLLDQTAAIADRLRALGVGQGVLVAICMERCHTMVAALLAVFRTGAAYLPLDPAFPPDRIAFMLADAQPLVVITQSELRHKLQGKAPHIITLEEAPLVLAEQRTETTPEPSIDQTAYVIYTSGSTGKPKGVAITHRSLTHLLLTVSAQLPLTSSDVVVATSTISFDISIFELFAPLIAGATLVVAPRAVAADGDLLAATLKEQRATIMQATPSGWRLLVASGWTGLAGLKMLSAGEALDLSLAHSLLDRGATLWNLYGPTEATIYATSKQITKDQTKITIGKPLPDYTVHILDDAGQWLPAGQVGELCLGGIGVATGYLHRPELTSEKFIPDPFSNHPANRLYRTGDLARLSQDGEIELFGRVDNQVKLRGYRIELEEVEALLDSHPRVTKSVVRMIDLDKLDQRLVAYVLFANNSDTGLSDLRSFASQRLPAYMVPAQFLNVTSFALTPSGKVDRQALPSPARLTGSIEGENNDTHGSLDNLVLNTFRSSLGVADLTAETDFFCAGGHSLLAVRVCTEIGEKLSTRIPVGWLIRCPTAQDFTNLLRSSLDTQGKCLVPLQKEGSLPPIYFVHSLVGDILVYRALAKCFAPHRPAFGFEAPANFESRPRPFSLEDLAAEHVQELLQRQPEGPFHLAGFSTGSVFAFEMARQLERAGHQVGLLALLDGDMETVVRSRGSFDRWKTSVRKLCKIYFKFEDEFSDGIKVFFERRIGYFRFKRRVRQLADMPAEAEATVEQALRLTEIGYQPKPYLGRALLIRFHDEAASFGPNPLKGWDGLTQGGLEVIDTPGGHFTGMNTDRAPALAAFLNARMQQVECLLKQGLQSESSSPLTLQPN